MMILILDFCFMVLDANLLISNCVHVGVRTSHSSWIVQLLSRWQLVRLVEPNLARLATAYLGCICVFVFCICVFVVLLDCSTFVATAVGAVGRAQFGPTCYRVSCRRPILATTCPGQPSAYLRAYVAEIEGGTFDQSGSIN